LFSLYFIIYYLLKHFIAINYLYLLLLLLLLLHRKHTDDRRYGCDKCDKSFLYSDAVKWHQIRTHKEPPPFACSLCHKKFIHFKTYETHTKEHDEETGSLSVPCPICKKKISEKRHLPRHIRTHLKKGFTCHYCHESFKERFQLTK